MLLLGTGGFGLFQLLLAPERSVVACSVLLFAIGVSFTLWTSNSNSYLQLGAPEGMRGRVVGLYYYSFNGAGPLGGVTAGWLSARGGTGLAFFVAGLIGVAMTAVAALQLRAQRPARARTEPEPESLAA